MHVASKSLFRTEEELLVRLLLLMEHHHHRRDPRANLIGQVPQRIGRARRCLFFLSCRCMYVPVECHSERRWHRVRPRRRRRHHRFVPLAQPVERAAARELADAVEG